MDSDLPGLKDHGKHYPSSDFVDELAWGNLWMYFATSVRFPLSASSSVSQSLPEGLLLLFKPTLNDMIRNTLFPVQAMALCLI